MPRRKKQSSEAAVRDIRRVLDGLRGEISVAELCRREGIAANLYYRWSKDFLEAGKTKILPTLPQTQQAWSGLRCGFVEDDNGPVEGATVSIYGANPAITTTTNGAGHFALEAIDIDPYILIEAPGHWGTLERVSLHPAVDVRGNYVFDVPEDAVVDEVAAALGRTQLDTNGIVIADFFSPDTLDGATATIDIVSDPSFAFDANGDPVESTSIIPGSEDTELIFSNAVVGDVDLMAGSTNPSLGCSGEFPFDDNRFPVLAKVISRLRIFCGSI
jgi:hypothetical protein